MTLICFWQLLTHDEGQDSTGRQPQKDRRLSIGCYPVSKAKNPRALIVSCCARPVGAGSIGKHLLGALYYQVDRSPIFGIQETSVPETTVWSSQDITMVEGLGWFLLGRISITMKLVDEEIYRN